MKMEFKESDIAAALQYYSPTLYSPVEFVRLYFRISPRVLILVTDNVRRGFLRLYACVLLYIVIYSTRIIGNDINVVIGGTIAFI